MSLKVKLLDMTDWHILPGLKIDVLIACCRLSVNPPKLECYSRYSARGHLQKFAAHLSLSTPQNSQPCKIFTLSLNSNQNLHTRTTHLHADVEEIRSLGLPEVLPPRFHSSRPSVLSALCLGFS